MKEWPFPVAVVSGCLRFSASSLGLITFFIRQIALKKQFWSLASATKFSLMRKISSENQAHK